jgi:ABC-type transport system involved in cytochrome c biogenesis permease subunit
VCGRYGRKLVVYLAGAIGVVANQHGANSLKQIEGNRTPLTEVAEEFPWFPGSLLGIHVVAEEMVQFRFVSIA